MGLKNFVVPLQEVEKVLKAQGIIKPDAEVVSVKELVEQYSVSVLVKHETYPDMEAGSPIPGELVYLGVPGKKPKAKKDAE